MMSGNDHIIKRGIVLVHCKKRELSITLLYSNVLILNMCIVRSHGLSTLNNVRMTTH